MQVELAQLLRDVPRQVRYDAVVEREKMDERRGCIDVLFINIIGDNLGSVQWCPNDNPPSLDETLAWIWFIRPDLRESIARSAPLNLQSLMDHYAREDLAGWYRLLRADDGGSE